MYVEPGQGRLHRHRGHGHRHGGRGQHHREGGPIEARFRRGALGTGDPRICPGGQQDGLNTGGGQDARQEQGEGEVGRHPGGLLLLERREFKNTTQRKHSTFDVAEHWMLISIREDQKPNHHVLWHGR